ncbi:MAG: sigma-70 family RNA polymerase sigma factor [Nocardioidaceae bacterium]
METTTARHPSSPRSATPPAGLRTRILPTSARTASPDRAGHAELTHRLLSRADAEVDPHERRLLQDEVVVLHIGLARSIANRFRGRGIAEDDLTQAAAMALVKAARSFDPDHGTPFLAYAAATVTGEVKRQFRDYAWMVRPPRPIQRLQAEVNQAQDELSHRLGRSPRVAEVATCIGASEDSVVEALAADGCYSPTSLDLPVGADGSAVLGDLLAGEDSAMDDVEARVMLTPAVRALPRLERTVLYLRFFRQQTQTQIAAEVGVTQMQVSRILTRVLRQLHGSLT